MQFILLKIVHRFRSSPDALEVTLVIDSGEFIDHEGGEITVSIESTTIKNMTLHEIESLAIARASTLIK